MNQQIDIKPVGVVHSAFTDPSKSPAVGFAAVIEVYPEYAGALYKIEKNSHLWILTWFHKADRQALAAAPARVDPGSPAYGVFGLRAPARPNPVALTLVELEGVEGTRLRVSGCDAVDGTPVIDIKPYFASDIVFSPRTPYIRPARREMRTDFFLKQAITHHQETCAGLFLGVRMAVVAEETFGQLTAPLLSVTVAGPACLADTLQGLTGARLANPPRFAYEPGGTPGRSVWRKGRRELVITARRAVRAEEFGAVSDEDLFAISRQSALLSGRSAD